VVEKWYVYDHVDELVTLGVEGNLDPRELETGEWEWEGEDEVCPIQFEWVRTDPWRGYHTPKAGEGWVRVWEDCALAGSEDEGELRRFHEKLIRSLWRLGRALAERGRRGFEFAIAFEPTSNIFALGYDVLVRGEEGARLAELVVAALAKIHRDFRRFALTALTGKSGGFDEKDELLLEAWERLQAGEDPDTVLNEILEKAKTAG
jgi:hypothetical protein